MVWSCVLVAAEPKSSWVYVSQLVWTYFQSCLPSPSCLVGIGGDDVVGVEVTWITQMVWVTNAGAWMDINIMVSVSS